MGEGMLTSVSSGGAMSSDNTTSGTPASASSSGSGERSSSGGAASDTSTAANTTVAGAGGAPAARVPGIIAVGYGGLRVVSRDLGETWEDEIHWSENGGDDRDLLRTIAHGNGIWVSGGWRITTSLDGVHWTDRGDAADVIEAVNCQITDGLAFGAGQFLIACGSRLASSADGLTWQGVGDTPDVGKHPYLVFDPETQQFACSGDDGVSFVSSDGAAWTEIAIESVHLCAGGLTPEQQCPSFYYDGIFLSTEWGGWIRRSEDASEWITSYADQFGNNLFTRYAFAAGPVAPG